MADDHIRYDILAQDALRGVMRKVLAEVARTGLPGNHHFFITFLTNAPGVRVSSRLRERYPEQMTIVLQFQYWDLKVTETGFEVGLSFSDVPEKLEVPFAAVRGFYDPSVNFELEFDVKPEVAAQAPPKRRRKRSPRPRATKVPAIGAKKAEPRAKAEPAAEEAGRRGSRQRPEGRRRRFARRFPQEVARPAMAEIVNLGQRASARPARMPNARPRRTARCSAAARPKSSAIAPTRTGRAPSSTAIAATSPRRQQ